ncbi:ABC transporter permease [Rubritalea tangerina]|uniref:ABC transporter permease n=1 Tax=Rubritalea tangerina TaxID=430798 RepID=A0ABW4ZEX2_9BACT
MIATLEPLSQITGILGALSLVALAIAISYWQKINLEASMTVAVVRAFVQLIAIGYALQLIFDSSNPWWIAIIITIMLSVAALTSGKRAAKIPHARRIAFYSISISLVLTLGTLLLLNVFEPTPRSLIPIAGMIIGNAMTSTSLSMMRLRDDLRQSKDQIETALALGAPSRTAAQTTLRTALSTGMTPMIDSTKTVGLIALPGAMTGMILAGSPPIEAVQLQLIVMFMLVGATAFASICATFLTYRQFFTQAHQLKI